MAKLVGFSFDYLAAHPDFIALLNDENGQGARHLQRSRQTVGPGRTVLTRPLCDYRRGFPRVDPARIRFAGSAAPVAADRSRKHRLGASRETIMPAHLVAGEVSGKRPPASAARDAKPGTPKT